jgi:hypothetical protein
MTIQTGPVPASESAQEPAQAADHASRREPAALVRCYGAIGISAVAAALRYAGVRKNPAYAPAVHHADARYAELLA